MEKDPKDPGKAVAKNTAQAAAERANDKRLLTLVESEIIPRLMMAHRDQSLPLAPAISRSEVVDFTHALLAQKISEAYDIVREICERGEPIQARSERAHV